MALTGQQIGDLNLLNKRIAEGYKANQTDLANLEYAKSKGYVYNPMPDNYAKVAGPSGLAGLGESDIYRLGKDIYSLQVPDTLTMDEMNQSVTIPQAEQLPNFNADSLMNVNTGTDYLNNLIKQQMTSTPSQAEYDATRGKIAEVSEKQKTAQRDLQEQKWEQFKLQENFDEINKLMPQIAKAQADYMKFQEEYQNLPYRSRIIGGTADRMARQQAVEMAGLSAIAQAYQGNIDLARNITQDALNAQYQDYANYFNSLSFQLSAIERNLNQEERNKANALQIAIDERQRQLTEERVQKENIMNLGLTIAQAGGSSEIVSQILKASSPERAIELAVESGVFQTSLTGWSKIGQTSNGEDLFYDDLTKTFRTGDQLVMGQLGTQVGTIMGLPAYDTRAANPGLTRSDRNNNPGNIKVSEYTKTFEGVIGVESNPAEDGGFFLIFENPEAGLDAIGRLLLEGKSYQNVNAETAIKRYNGNGSYGASSVGLNPNGNFQDQIKDINKRREVARAIAMAEGWSGGAVDIINNEEALSWAKLINDGQANITNVPTKMRDAVANELAGMESKSKALTDIVAQEKANMAIDLINHKGLNNAVGTVALGRIALPGSIGSKADFIASVEQLVSGLSLETLVESKSRGATFGALSDTEMRILASSATKIGTWAIRNKKGKVTGYKASEKAFKEELANIAEILVRGIEQVDPLDIGITNDSLGLFN